MRDDVRVDIVEKLWTTIDDLQETESYLEVVDRGNPGNKEAFHLATLRMNRAKASFVSAFQSFLRIRKELDR